MYESNVCLNIDKQINDHIYRQTTDVCKRSKDILEEKGQSGNKLYWNCQKSTCKKKCITINTSELYTEVKKLNLEENTGKILNNLGLGQDFIFCLCLFCLLLIDMGHSCFTMLYQFLLYSKVNQLYVYIYALFFRFPFHLGYSRGSGLKECRSWLLFNAFNKASQESNEMRRDLRSLQTKMKEDRKNPGIQAPKNSEKLTLSFQIPDGKKS